MHSTPGAPDQQGEHARGDVDIQRARDPLLRGATNRMGDVTRRIQDGGPPQLTQDRAQQKQRLPLPRPTTPCTPASTSTIDRVGPPFDDIRRLCEGSLPFNRPVDTRPQAVAEHRRRHWPSIINIPDRQGLAEVYNLVKNTGLPNAMAARVPLETKLNIPAWEWYLGGLGDRGVVLDFVRFGFPIGYVGPTSDTIDTPNHPSATRYPQHIDKFIQQEIALEGLLGPFDTPPLYPMVSLITTND